MENILDAAMDPRQAIELLDNAHQVADSYRGTLQTNRKSQVTYTISLDLAYKGCKRASAIGMAHHLVHSNHAVDQLGGGGGELRQTMSGLRDAFGARGVWAALFNLTQHQAIGEKSYCKTAFSARVSGGMHLLKGVGKTVSVRKPNPGFAIASPTKMRGSFSRYLEQIDIIAERVGTQTLHEQVTSFFSELELPDLIDAVEAQSLCEAMDIVYFENHQIMQEANSLVLKTDELTWLEYFIAAGNAIVDAGLGSAVAGHLFTQLHRPVTEAPGLLFGVLNGMGRLGEFEEIFFENRAAA